MRNPIPGIVLVLASALAGAASAAEAPAVPPAYPPNTISLEAQAVLSKPPPGPPASAGPPSLPLMRQFTDGFQASFSAVQQKRYAVDIHDDTLAGVPVRIISPRGVAPGKKLLLNLHGGGFMLDSGSLTENIPLAALTGISVIAIRYPLAPEHPYPAALDASVAVYRELLKTHAASDLVLYGTSAGAVLTAEMAVRLQALKLPLPAAMGFFSGSADLSRPGETGSNPLLTQGQDPVKMAAPYAGATPLTDPTLSPLFADLHGLPPILLISSTHDFLLSQASIFHRALLHAGVDARLVVFEGLPHAFWSYMDVPESTEAFEMMANFFKDHLQH